MIQHSTDLRVTGCELHYLSLRTRMPLKFGPETLTDVTCARVRVRIETRAGARAEGWGETPLSVQWVWPGALTYAERRQTLMDFCARLGAAITTYPVVGHPMEVSVRFQAEVLPGLLRELNAARAGRDPMPWLAALVCFSAFDLALHDAFGHAVQQSAFTTLHAGFMNRDLDGYLEPDAPGVSFAGRYPADFLLPRRRDELPAWHLVAGLDPLTAGDLIGEAPRDGYPVLLSDWIRTDGLTCLKVKLKGTDAAWDYARLVRVGEIGWAEGVQWLTADFNCTVHDPEYVVAILDRFAREHPRLSDQLLYVEQPFPYELEEHRIDVRAVSARKPLFLDESAHDWHLVRLGRQLGWTGVALKTCKTLTGALLSAAWARAHGMALMVQDLTNPMLAQIAHVQLAAHVDTIMGVETNSMQFYPEASAPEAAVHPGIYRRRQGRVDLRTIHGPGLGYRLAEIQRPLPAPAGVW